MRLLFTVTDRFLIQGRGVVLCPGVPVEESGRTLAVRIERPDGSSFVTDAWPEHLSGFATLDAARRWAAGPRAVCVRAEAAADVPVGSQVWAVDP